MNYIWDVIVKAKNEDIDLKNINFKRASIYSPYMELSDEAINFDEIKNEVKINPYYRFSEIFKNLFPPDYNEEEELREVFLDIMIHFLSQIDIHQGLDRVEYYKKFIYREIKNGYFGQTIRKGIDYLDLKERNVLLDNIYKFYNTGDHIYYLKDTIKRIFQGSLSYVNKNNINEILVYLNRAKTKENLKKLEVIEELFLPMNFKMKIYWENHFGIIGIAETMKIGEISIYQRKEATS